MTIKHHIYGILLATLTGCAADGPTGDNVIGPDGGLPVAGAVPITFGVAVEGSMSASTRADADSTRADATRAEDTYVHFADGQTPYIYAYPASVDVYNDFAATNAYGGENGFVNLPLINTGKTVDASQDETGTEKYYQEFTVGSNNKYAYYPEDGTALQFYAYYPYVDAAGNETAIKRPYDIKPQYDIMVGILQNGSNSFSKARNGETQEQPKFIFYHLLQQLRFKLVQGEGFPSNAVATEIRVKQIWSHVRVHPFRALTDDYIERPYEESGKTDISLPLSAGSKTYPISPLATAGEAGDVLMLDPRDTEFDIEVKVRFADNTTHTFSTNIDLVAQGAVTSGAPISDNRGVSHLITLTFQGSKIIPQCKVAPWNTGGYKTIPVE